MQELIKDLETVMSILEPTSDLFRSMEQIKAMLPQKTQYSIRFYELPDEDKTYIELETTLGLYRNYEESEDGLWLNQTLKGEASATEINFLIKTLQLT